MGCKPVILTLICGLLNFVLWEVPRPTYLQFRASSRRCVKASRGPMKNLRRGLLLLILVIAVLAALSFPERPTAPRSGPDVSVALTAADAQPFKWDEDGLWRSLERRFVRARAGGCDQIDETIDAELTRLSVALSEVERGQRDPSDQRWDVIESLLFEIAPLVAACPTQAAEFVGAYADVRLALKEQSRAWDLNDRSARIRMYRLLYGGRAAVEEVLLQMDSEAASALSLVTGVEEHFDTPSAMVRGVRVYSGDILVSRGGFPTSALIARGSDYPGNFSHVALLHVNKNDQPTVIEAHIESGLTTTSVSKYFVDKKLRIMLLRPRRDLPQLVDNPLAPHIAASRARARAVNSHVPYDFEMDYRNPDKLFCSEVASSAYREQGIQLWTGISTISAEGLQRWLAGFGVKYFETQEPSDLEYDPQLNVVAEWRDPQALFDDHVDNAVTDAMLEGANQGDEITYPALLLPFTRLAKGYSVVLNKLRRVGPVPEGMSAPSALRNRSYTKRHESLSTTVHARAAAFEAEHGYRAPYWKLVSFARDAVAESD